MARKDIRCYSLFQETNLLWRPLQEGYTGIAIHWLLSLSILNLFQTALRYFVTPGNRGYCNTR